MYGVDDSGVKASRTSKSAEEIAKAYLDAVPKRMILSNALESVRYKRGEGCALWVKLKSLFKHAKNKGVLLSSPNNKRVSETLARNGLQLSTPLKLTNPINSIADLYCFVKIKNGGGL